MCVRKRLQQDFLHEKVCNLVKNWKRPVSNFGIALVEAKGVWCSVGKVIRNVCRDWLAVLDVDTNAWDRWSKEGGCKLSQTTNFHRSVHHSKLIQTLTFCWQTTWPSSLPNINQNGIRHHHCPLTFISHSSSWVLYIFLSRHQPTISLASSTTSDGSQLHGIGRKIHKISSIYHWGNAFNYHLSRDDGNFS